MREKTNFCVFSLSLSRSLALSLLPLFLKIISLLELSLFSLFLKNFVSSEDTEKEERERERSSAKASKKRSSAIIVDFPLKKKREKGTRRR